MNYISINNPKEIHAYLNDDGTFRVVVKRPVYKRFGLPDGKYMGDTETTIGHCEIVLKAITGAAEITIGGTDE